MTKGFALVGRFPSPSLLGILLAVALAPAAATSEALEESAKVSSPVQIESVFLRGLRLMQAGEPREAVVLFRRILSGNPDLPRVRLELARAYFQMESWSESREQFVAVLSSDVPSAVRKNILRFIRAIDARRGFDWDAAIGLSVSPEAGRDYKTDTVELDFLGTKLPFKLDREKKDVLGLRFSGSAEIRRGLVEFASGPSLVAFLGASAHLFEADGSMHDDYVFRGSAGSRVLWPQTTAVAAFDMLVRHKAGDIREDRKGLRSSVEYRFESGFSPLVTMSYSDVNIHDADAQDGDLYGIRAGFSAPVLGVANVGSLASFERFDARESFESYTAAGFSVVGQADVGLGIGALARGSVEHRNYDERIPLFPKIRDDLELSFDLELIKNDVFLLDYFSPFVKMGYTHNKSAIDIFTYDEYRFLVGVKNAF